VSLNGRLVATGVAIVALLAVQAPAARADNPPPCASPSPAAASSSRTCTDATASALDQLKQRLGGDLAKALTTQQTLSQAVDAASASEQLLSDELTIDEARVQDLQNQIAQLDQQIADLETQIDAEKEQIATLARAMYRRPASFLDIVASSGNLSQALIATADMIVAGQRAHALQDRLQSNLAKVQADRDARQSDLDKENATLAVVQSGLDQLATVQGTLDDLTAQLADLIGRIQSAAAQLPNVSPDVTAALAQVLEADQLTLAQESQAAAWAQANAGAGMAGDLNELPVGNGPAGLKLSWPMLSGTITQPFGPTSFVLEPPLGSYAHFHTGIDIAAPLGSAVVAAGDGVVVAVAHTWVGYGNYVIVAHGSGVLTLYAHLLDTAVTPGAHVTRGELLGREGSSGYSTGPHLHFEVRVNGQVTDPLRYLPPR
jgi:murein DD-endopeptidase MepM/ murein hydrolase activator NlpD